MVNVLVWSCEMMLGLKKGPMSSAQCTGLGIIVESPATKTSSRGLPENRNGGPQCLFLPGGELLQWSRVALFSLALVMPIAHPTLRPVGGKAESPFWLHLVQAPNLWRALFLTAWTLTGGDLLSRVRGTPLFGVRSPMSTPYLVLPEWPHTHTIIRVRHI